MTQKPRILFAVAFAMLSAGCMAHVPMAPTEHDLAAKEFRVAPGKANLYVYRSESFGGAVKMKVLLDGTLIGETAPKTYFVVPVQPGPHKLMSKAENDDELALAAEPGKNYFVWQEVKMGFLSARTKLHLMDDKEGKSAVAECSLAQRGP